jgi:peptide deformylase
MSAILTHPNILLREVSKEVELPLNPDDQSLIDTMKSTMYEKKGIGLAAIQIGYQKRIAVMDTSASRDQPIILINPEVIDFSEESLEVEEGCLSAPGKFGHPRRNLRITIAYNCEHGKRLKRTFYDMAAQCVQHELDHMNGKLCIDYD